MIPVITTEYKLVLVGDSAVGNSCLTSGKSSILCQFVDGKFDDKLLSTIGVDFKFRKVKIGSEEVKLQIWDTAGQETFRSIVSAYYSSADAIILCYDISNYDSFESMKDYWLTEAQNNNKTNAKVYVVGNKLDSKRQVESFSVETLKSSNIAGFYEVSAKQNTNIESTFVAIAKMLHAQKGTKKPQVKKQGTQLRSNTRQQNDEESGPGVVPQGKKKCCPA